VVHFRVNLLGRNTTQEHYRTISIPEVTEGSCKNPEYSKVTSKKRYYHSSELDRVIIGIDLTKEELGLLDPSLVPPL